jgi:hypothetical protein
MILLAALLAIAIIVAEGVKKPPKRPPRYKKFSVKQKLEAVDYAAMHNFSAAAEHFRIRRTTIAH